MSTIIFIAASVGDRPFPLAPLLLFLTLGALRHHWGARKEQHTHGEKDPR